VSEPRHVQRSKRTRASGMRCLLRCGTKVSKLAIHPSLLAMASIAMPRFLWNTTSSTPRAFACSRLAMLHSRRRLLFVVAPYPGGDMTLHIGKKRRNGLVRFDDEPNTSPLRRSLSLCHSGTHMRARIRRHDNSKRRRLCQHRQSRTSESPGWTTSCSTRARHGDRCHAKSRWVYRKLRNFRAGIEAKHLMPEARVRLGSLYVAGARSLPILLCHGRRVYLTLFARLAQL